MNVFSVGLVVSTQVSVLSLLSPLHCVVQPSASLRPRSGEMHSQHNADNILQCTTTLDPAPDQSNHAPLISHCC